MKKQLPIENFFNQSKRNISLLTQSDAQIMTDKKFKRRNLSILKSETPSKSPKKSSSDTCVQKVSPKITTNKQDVISLVSDDEDDFRTSPKDSSKTLSQNSNNSGAVSYNSEETIGCSLTPETPQKSSPTTPTQSSSPIPNHSKVSPKILGSSTPIKVHNSVSKIKYYSPTKNRGVVMKTPLKLKRNLSAELRMPSNNNSDDVFAKACENMDDKKSSEFLKSETPSKSPKESSSNTCVQKVSRKMTTNKQDVISLVSDDEDDFRNSPKESSKTLSQNSNNSAVVSYNSDETIGYSLTPGTPQKSSPTTHTQSSSQIPNHSEVSPKIMGSSNPIKVHNSGSKIKYFSPTKKRGVVKKTPLKVKRNLCAELRMPSNNNSDNVFAKACENMDDKTIFLLSTINTFINDVSTCNLLDSEAQAILENCLRVIKPGMRLVCRLYWRKVGWYKKANVNQIASEDRKEKTLLDNLHLETMLESLLMYKLLDEGNKHTMTFEDFTDILNKDDLMEVCKELKLKVSSKKDAIKALVGFSRSSANNITKYFTGHTSCNSRIALKLMSEKAGTCYKLSEKARSTLDRLYILSYLGIDYNIIREKKLELMLLYDKINRETHPVDKNMELDNASIVFRNKDDFERYMTAHEIYEDFISKTDSIEKCTIVQQVFDLYKEIEEEQINRCKTLPLWLHRFTPAYKYVKILEAGIQDLKRNKDGSRELLALEILASLISQNTFRQTKKQEWYAETARIYHILNQFEKEAETLLAAFKSNFREEAKDILRPRALALAGRRSAPLPQQARDELKHHANAGIQLEGKLPSEHVYKQPMEYSGKRGKVKFQTRTAEGRMVQDAEEYCIGHYLLSGDFTEGEHWEGRIVTTLFFLLFFDIVYTKPEGVPGVFLSRYQTFPLDLFCEAFYTNRKQAIDVRLKLIENSTEEEFLGMMRTTWDARPEHELSGITRAVGWESARGVARCLGAKRLAAVCGRLARDYRYTHSGFPDLTVWNPHTKQIKFVEVKTDSDKPSMKQIQWMYYLREHGIDTEFCYLGVNTTRQRSRTTGKSPDPKRSRMDEKKMNSPKTKSPKKIKKEAGQTSKLFPKPMQEKVKEEPSINDIISLTEQDILNSNVKIEFLDNIKTESRLDDQEDKSNSEEITVNGPSEIAVKMIDSSQVKKSISSCSRNITVEVLLENANEKASPFHVRVKKPQQINEDALNPINVIDVKEENQAQMLSQIRDKNCKYGSIENEDTLELNGPESNVVNKIIRTGPQDVLAELEESESSHCMNSRDTLILETIDE